MEPLLFNSSNGYRREFGAYLRSKCYLEERNPKLYALMLKVKDVFLNYEEGEYGKGADCAEKAVDALAQIIAEAQNEDWTEPPPITWEEFANSPLSWEELNAKRWER